MDRREVYNMALDTLNIEPLDNSVVIDNNATDPIVKTLNRFYGTALRKASREHDWSFLTERIVLGEDLGSARGYGHSYELPDSLFRLIYAEGGDYLRVGSTLLTNGSPVIYAITLDKDRKNNYYFGQEDLVPDDFWELVAYALAFFASARLSSGDAKTNVIMGMYNTILQTMVNNDVKNEIHPVTDAFEEDAFDGIPEGKQRRNWNVQFAETENTWR